MTESDPEWDIGYTDYGLSKLSSVPTVNSRLVPQIWPRPPIILSFCHILTYHPHQ